jgi:hypothetical protein
MSGAQRGAVITVTNGMMVKKAVMEIHALSYSLDSIEQKTKYPT